MIWSFKIGTPFLVPPWLLRSKPALGFSDCLMIELARKSGHLPFGTFDRALAKVDGGWKL